MFGVPIPQINQMIADVDKDGRGAIDFKEFCQMMTTKLGERDTQKELLRAFRIIDHDNNVGKNSAQDVHLIAKDLGENFIDREIQVMIEEVDRDRDGEIRVEEFSKIMKTSYAY